MSGPLEVTHRTFQASQGEIVVNYMKDVKNSGSFVVSKIPHNFRWAKSSTDIFKSIDFKFDSLSTDSVNTNSEPRLCQWGELFISFSHSYLLPILSRITKNTGQLIFYFFIVSMEKKKNCSIFYIRVSTKLDYIFSLLHVAALDVTSPCAFFFVLYWRYKTFSQWHLAGAQYHSTPPAPLTMILTIVFG